MTDARTDHDESSTGLNLFDGPSAASSGFPTTMLG